ncbi:MULTISPECIES: hypothetical protein [unclassified Azospirillum]|uniref:hypothetical protein n=1 Tax=unclassified Azospirillum TaxID=2630922 RepID=UPI001178A340|nr:MULTISPECIES: hypothetical protein [unclassified Azospirillum]
MQARLRGAQPPGLPTAPPISPAPTPPSPPAPLRHGQNLSVRILAVAEPVLEQLPPNALPATLMGSTSQGQPVLSTPQGMLVLKGQTNLPPGTALTVVLDVPSTAEAAPTMLPPLDPRQGQDWPAMKEVMAMLAATDPVLARHLAQTILPQPNKRLTTNLTFFLAALRGGDAAGWLGGDAVDSLERRGGGRLLAQLREDFQAVARQAAEPTAEGWRSMAIPFGPPEQLGRMQLAVRNALDGEEKTGDGGEEKGKAQRFLLDLSFSRLGPMQLDGLVRPGRLDLMIRTLDLLPAELRQGIGELFRDSLETVGFAGTIGFQTGAHRWAKVQTGRQGPSRRV